MNFKLSNSLSWARKKFEIFGRTLLLPVSIIPILGMLYAIGSFFSSLEANHHSETLKHFADGFKMLGRVALSNLDVLFAIGIATGLAKRERPSAALAAIVGLIGLYYASAFVLTMWHPNSLLDAKGKIMGTATKFGRTCYDFGVFGGILTGLLAYWIHEKTYRIQFPTVFSFFGGTKFSPVASALGLFAIGIGLTFVWAGLNSGLSKVGEGLNAAGAAGSGIYGGLERLLIPFGLHQTVNNAIKWTDMGGTMQIPTFNDDGTLHEWKHAVGQLGIVQTKLGLTREQLTNFFSVQWLDSAKNSHAALTGVALDNMVNKYYQIPASTTILHNGQFVTKGFSLVGAAVAMIMAAPKSNRKQVSSMLIAAAFTSAFTGITEPIEFSFLFAAPMLYGIHILLTGISFAVMYALHSSGSSLAGAGMFQWVLFIGLNSSRFPKFWIIWIVGPIMGSLYFATFYFLIKWRNLPTPGRADGEIKLATASEARAKYGIKVNRLEKDTGEIDIADTPEAEEFPKGINIKMAKKLPLAYQIIMAHGGPENIETINNCISRLRIDVKNKNLVDSEWLKSKESQSLGFAWNGNQAQTIYGGKVMKMKVEVEDVLDMSM